MSGDTLRQLPLAEQHRSLGARFAPFAGWEMPVQYSGIVEEHHAVRERAGIFDVSHMGRLYVSGAKAGQALRRAVDARIPLITDAEVLQEILHRYFGIHRPDAAAAVYRSTVGLCAEVTPITEKDTARALELLQSHAELTPRDAIHVATMESAGVSRLLSADRDFDVVPSVQRVDPTEFAPGSGGPNR